MTSQKNHKYNLPFKGEAALDKSPLCIKLDNGLKEQIRAIPDWQGKLRKELSTWVAKWNTEIDNASSSNRTQ